MITYLNNLHNAFIFCDFILKLLIWYKINIYSIKKIANNIGRTSACKGYVEYSIIFFHRLERVY